MRTLVLALAVVLLSAVPGKAEMYRYEDEHGNIAFVDDPSKIPPQYRASARAHVPAPEGKPADLATGDLQGILQKRREIISHYTPEQAESAVRKGLLTVDEVDFLVRSGALRASAAGDTYRFAGKRSAAAATAPAVTQADAAERDLIQLQALLPGAAGGGALDQPVIRQFLSRVTNNPNARYALYGEGALFALLLVSLPFLLRRYHDDGTRRIIRASLFFIFVIVSATGNLLLFRDDIAFLLSAGKAPLARPAPAGAQALPPSK